MINSRKIEDLHPVVEAKCRQLIANCKKKGVDIIVTSTLRDAEYQAELYAQGRTKSGNIVTNMKLIGAHAFGLAFDVVPVVKGNAIWDNDKYWEIISEEGKKIGLESGKDWKGFRDCPHFQMVDGLTAEQLRVGKRPSFWDNKKPKPVKKPTIVDKIKDVIKPKPKTKIDLKVGSTIIIKTTTKKYATGQIIPDEFKGKKYHVMQIDKDNNKILVKQLYSWVKISDVVVVG